MTRYNAFYDIIKISIAVRKELTGETSCSSLPHGFLWFFITDAGYPPPLRFTKAAGSIFERRCRVSIPHRLKLPASVDGVARANQASLLEFRSWLNYLKEESVMFAKKRLAPIFVVMLMIFAMVLLLSAYEAYAAGSANDEISVVQNDTEAHTLLDPISCEEGEQLLPVTIDPAEGTAAVDGSGEEEPIKDVFALSSREKKELTGGSTARNREAILDYLLEEPCIVHKQDDGTLRAAYPFSIKTLFVLLKEGQLKDTYGAENAVYDRESRRYILQYASQEDTARAYAKLTDTWGRKKVLVDLPVAPTEIKYDEVNHNQTYSSFTTAKSLSWGTDVMYLDRLRDWTEQNRASGNLFVAVIDSGIRVDQTNEEIINGFGIDSSRIMKNYCRSITSSVFDYTALHDYYVTDTDSYWQPKKCAYADLGGHGTHVISTVLDGTPSNVKVFVLRDTCENPKKYNSTRYSTGDIDAMVKSVEWAGKYGAKVVNISQGIRCYDYEAGTYKGYYGKGITDMENIGSETFNYYNNELASTIATYDLCVVAAAGNDAEAVSKRMHFPAINSAVIAVSNLKYSDGFVLKDSSNYGDNVSFCAPGTSIVGAGYDWDTQSACYTVKSGTSMAAPHITAALAILRLYYRDLDNTEAVDFLKEFCTDLGDPGKDDKYGFGFPQFKKQFNMTYVYNDSATANKTVTIPKGMKLTRPKNPERYGYHFGGWYTDKACTQEFNFTKPVMEASYLYAKWYRANKHVIFEYNGHGGTSRYEIVPQGTCVSPPPTPIEEGWTFCGWYFDTALTKKFDFSTPIDENINLYALWKKVTLKAIKPTVALSSSSYTYNGKIKTPGVTVKDGSVVLKKDTDYKVTFASGRRNAGTYKVTVTLKGKYSGSGTASFTIKKAANPLKIKGKKAVVKYKKLKKKTQKLAVARVIRFTKKGQGKISYKLSSARKGKKSYKKYFRINAETGKVTLKKIKKKKKGLKKGLYKVKVKVKAAGNKNYKPSAWKTVTIKIRIK